MTLTLADILDPITPERFFAEYFDKQPLHIPGGAAKFAQVLSWRQINRLLDMTHIWSSQSLKLVREGVAVPPEQYCTRASSRDGTPVMQPDQALVAQWIGRGASLVLNDVDSLSPGLASISTALEEAGLGKAQANAYISWQSHKAFHTHFDTHDVWAVQVEGEKHWNLWEGRAEWPLPHAFFKSLSQEHHDRARGKLRAKVLVKTGDLLYLPRGWYHDALAEAPASVHIAYGLHAPTGMDLMTLLAERVLREPAFRQPLPRQDGTAAARFALTSRASQLGQRLSELTRDPKVMDVLGHFVTDYRYRRGGNDLLAARGIAGPASVAAGAEEGAAFRVLSPGAKPVRRGAEWQLKGPAATLPLPPAEAEAAAWLLARPDIAEAELRATHPAIDAPGLLHKLVNAGLLAPT